MCAAGFDYCDEPAHHPWNPRVRPDLGLVFVHIPKTGGNSIAYRMAQWPCLRQRTMHKHTRAIHLRNLLGESEWRRCFKFSVVRNPWDQAVSSYLWWLRTGPKIEHLRPMAAAVAALESFSAYLRSPYGEMLNECRGTPVDWLSVEGNLAVDYVIHFESLQAGWSEVCERARLASEPLPHVNSSPQRRPYQAYYDGPSRQIVANRYAREIEIFRYEY